MARKLGAAIAVVLAAVIAAASRGAPAPGSQAVGFEHSLHERDLVVRGGEALPCARCHAMRGGALVGKPDHAACFGACHGPPPHRGDKPGDRLAVCTSCHAEAVLVAGGAHGYPVHYPPYTLEPNFGITVGHRRHRAVACATCHAGKRPPHQRCAGCHDGSAAAGRGPAMTACTGCHTPATGKPMPPIIVHAEVKVTAAFSHARHAARGGDGARCASCHRALLDTDDNRLPAPNAATCAAARCHDGTAAFPVTAACVRCHVDPNDPEFKVARPTDRYSHASHTTVQLPCGACHPVGKSGEVRVVGHAPCVTCHADDFGQRQPRICGACHNGTEPWRALVADRGPPDDTEFGATLDHDKHPGDCARCHALTTPAEQLRPPRGHRACTGKGCHAASGGPAPALTACERCHHLGLARQRRTTRLAAAWSVRRAFDHAGHARGADGQPLACVACHVELHGPDVAELATPAKPTCAPCHDGTTAFKLTGTTCTRCHRGAP